MSVLRNAHAQIIEYYRKDKKFVFKNCSVTLFETGIVHIIDDQNYEHTLNINDCIIHWGKSKNKPMKSNLVLLQGLKK